MTPILLFGLGSFKKQVYFAVAVLLFILALPMAAVFAMGTGALSFLSGNPSSSTGNSAILTQTLGLYQGTLDPNDKYDWGNCTYWTSLLREQAGDPIPQNWGNAATWAFYALVAGYAVDHTPSPGAIMQISDVDGGLGHVAYLTTVDPTSGAWTISEMNVQGLDIVDTKTLPATAAANFNFIHDKVLNVSPNLNVKVGL